MNSKLRKTLSPALPPCDVSGSELGALYAGRFVVVPWEVLRRSAKKVFGAEAGARLEELVEASRSGRKAQRALATYQTLLEETSVMSPHEAIATTAEEYQHHKDLVQTPLWMLINGSAVCERLQLIHAQVQLSKRRRGRSLSRALGKALELHFLRRYLYAQMWPVAEVLNLLPRLARTDKPIEELNYFENSYESEAGLLALSCWRMRMQSEPWERPQEDERIRKLLLDSLSLEVVAPKGWIRLLQALPSWIGEDSWRSLPAAWAHERLISPTLPATRSRSQRLPILALRYFWYARDLGLYSTLARIVLGTFGLSLLPFLARLFQRDPYQRKIVSKSESAASRDSGCTADEAAAVSVPGLRALFGDHEIIIDPAALTRIHSRLAHQGMENALPWLADSEYTADQFILQRVSEVILDPGRSWSASLTRFFNRWAGLEVEERLLIDDLLQEIQPRIEGIAGSVLEAAGESSRDLEVELYRYALPDHLAVRARLLARIRQTAGARGRRSPVHKILHAYFIHGL